MSKIGCDLDGVVCDFNRAYGRLFIKLTGENRFGDDWETRLAANTFPSVWNWEDAAGYTPEQVGMVWKHIKQDTQFWRSLHTLPDAMWAIRELNTMANAGHDIYFLTNRMGDKAKLQTEKYLYDLGSNYPTVIMAADKLPIIRSLGLDFFIDDKPETILDVAAANLPNLKLYLRSAPYNMDIKYPDNVIRVGGVLEALNKAYGI